MSAPSPPPAPAPESEGHKDRLITWRAALVSAGVVLLAGLIGAGSSYIVADRQINSQAEQARQDFLRTQRQAAYVQFIADIRTAWNSTDFGTLGVDASSSTVKFAAETDQATLSALQDQMSKNIEALSTSIVPVQLFGTDEASADASGILSEWIADRNTVRQLLYCAQKNVTEIAGAPCPRPYLDLPKLDDMQDHFVEIARFDLGVS